ncbi:MAG: metallophosphoesterase [Elusimicrobia bacterium]|nr:metallophosphoesterase [Elusimicrobiota bacterium]
MRAVLVLAAAVLAAAGAGAQSFTRPVDLPAAPASFAAPAALGTPLPSFLLPASPLLLAAPPSVMGIPGPGVTPAHVAAVQRLADETGQSWFIHGSRQTGTRYRDGSAFTAASDLDLGVVGPPETIFAHFNARWDGVPDATHGPMAAAPSVEEAVARGHLVVSPRMAEPGGEHGVARGLASPYRTTAQLAKLGATGRGAGETFHFSVIGDAEPGRFWFSRALFNRDQKAFWKILARADKTRPDFIVQLGDMVSRGILRNFLNFFRRLREAAPSAPYLTVIGNHDRHSPHGVSNDRVYRSLWGGTDYSFQRGGWRFVVVDTSAGRLTAAQLSWLSETLEKGVPTVVFTHMPPAPLGEWTDFAGHKGAGGFREGAAEFMRLMSARGVSRVYVGHVHGFGVLDRGGVRYVLTGGGGSPLFPGPVKQRFHHSISVEAGPDGLVETVHPLGAAPFTLRP